MGAQISKSENDVLQVVDASVKTTLSSTVNASANSKCENIQSVTGAKCCKIKFSEQTCEATAVNEVVSSGRLDATVTQGIAQQIKQAAESSTEGIGGVYSDSEASNKIRNITRMAINTTQTFETNCSKNATGLNEQSVTDTYCGCGEEAPAERGIDVDFAQQSITLEAIGSCVSDVVGSSQSAQDFSSMIGQKGVSSVTGVDLFGLFLAVIGPMMIFIIAPIGFKIATAPQTEKPSPAQAAARTGQRVSKISFYFLLLALIVWYPGVIAWQLGAPPWQEYRDPILDTNVCDDDGTARADFIVNKYQWFDPDCVSKPAGSPCAERDQYKSYEGCGVFAKNGLCDDPNYTGNGGDKDLFDQMQVACEGINQLYEDRVPVGDTPAIAAIAMKRTYGEACTMCFSNEPGLKEKNGLFVTMDLDKLENDEFPECTYNSDKVIPKSCYKSCGLINPETYLAEGVNEGGGTIGCDASESAVCYEDGAAYESVSPNECRIPGYMQNKKRFSKTYRAVQAAETIYRQKFSTPEDPLPSPIQISAMCPVKPLDWLDCNGDYSCNYQTQLPASDPNFRFADAQCRNDFTDCEDAGYLLDLEAQDTIGDECKEQAERQKERDGFLDQVPLWSGVAYFIFFFVAVASSIYGSRVASEAAGKGGGFGSAGVDPRISKLPLSTRGYVAAGSSNLPRNLILFLLFGGVVAGGLMIGLVEPSPLYIGVTAGCAVLFIAFFFFFRKAKRMAKENQAAVKVMNNQM